MKKLALPLVMCILAVTACWPFDGEDALAAMTLRKSGGGRVQILRASQDPINVGEEDVSVQLGDVIRTFEGGLAEVALEGERVASVGGSEQLTKGVPEGQMKIISTSTVENETGTVMAEATDPMKVLFGDAVASGSDSVFRVDRRAGAARAASYKGTVRVAAPGEENVVLDRLFESPSTASDLRPAQPYHLNPADPFDGKQLANVIELENKLSTLSLGFASQLGKKKPDLTYFRAFAGNENVSNIKRYLGRHTIDLLLGFTVALNTKAPPFATALDEVFRHRDNGGSWGVVAAIVGSNPALLVADFEEIIQASQVVAGGTGGVPIFSAASLQNTSTGGGEEPPPDTGGNEPPPDTGGGNEPPPEEAEDCTSGPECDVNDVLPDDLPTPGPSPSDILGGIDDL